jgi:peptide/nickel transport system substrate-binding protein
VYNIKRIQQTATAPAHAYAELIKSVTAVDPLTVRFVLKEPLNTFDALFALPFWNGNLGTIASPTAIKKYGRNYLRHPVGAGPFEFVKWESGSEIVLKRNPNYWQAGLPYLAKLVFKPLPDTQTRYESLASGTIDIDKAGYFEELIRGAENPKLKVYYGSASGASYLTFNFRKAPFNDRRMREAVISAINLDALSKALYEGRMVRASTWSGPSSTYYSKKAASVWPKYDPERAKRLVAEYKADGGDPNFTFATTSNTVKQAQFFQAQWAAVGLHVKIASYDFSTYITKLVTGHDFQLAGWVGGPFIGPYPWMPRLFMTGGSLNYGGYSNPEMDAVLRQAATTIDNRKRIALYKEAQVIANQDLAFLWYTRSYVSTVAQKYVKGVVQYPATEQFFATLWLDK